VSLNIVRIAGGVRGSFREAGLGVVARRRTLRSLWMNLKLSDGTSGAARNQLSLTIRACQSPTPNSSSPPAPPNPLDGASRQIPPTTPKTRKAAAAPVGGVAPFGK
jgi:hypothetical protein